jgi:hypothetical protein
MTPLEAEVLAASDDHLNVLVTKYVFGPDAPVRDFSGSLEFQGCLHKEMKHRGYTWEASFEFDTRTCAYRHNTHSYPPTWVPYPINTRGQYRARCQAAILGSATRHCPTGKS